MLFFDWILTFVIAGNIPNSNFGKVVDGGHAYRRFLRFSKEIRRNLSKKITGTVKMTFSNPIKIHFIESQKNTYQLKRLVSCRPIKSIISNSKKVDGETWRKLVEENGR